MRVPFQSLIQSIAYTLLISATHATAAGHLTIVGTNTVDLGTYPSWESRSALYTLENSGQSDLQILNVRNSCGCATVNLPRKRLAPGAATTLDITILPNSIFGSFLKATYIQTSDTATPLTKIWVKGNATPLVRVTPHPFVSAGMLRLGQEREWRFVLTPTRTPLTFSPYQTTSSVPVDVEFSEPEANGSAGALRVRLPAQTVATKLDINIQTTATYGTNDVPLTFGITGLIGAHLVATPARCEITPQTARRRWTMRFHKVAPPHVPRTLALDALKLPVVAGVKFAAPVRDHTGRGLLIDMTLEDTFLSRLQEETAIPLTFRLPNAAPATVTCTVPTAKPPAQTLRQRRDTRSHPDAH